MVLGRYSSFIASCSWDIWRLITRTLRTPTRPSSIVLKDKTMKLLSRCVARRVNWLFPPYGLSFSIYVLQYILRLLGIEIYVLNIYYGTLRHGFIPGKDARNLCQSTLQSHLSKVEYRAQYTCFICTSVVINLPFMKKRESVYWLTPSHPNVTLPLKIYCVRSSSGVVSGRRQ